MNVQQGTSDLVTSSLSDQLTRILWDRIVNLVYPLGTKIDVESLKEEYGVSHIPIRDALHKLAEQGLVVVLPRIGYFTVEFSRNDVEELCDVRELMEVYSISRSIDRVERELLESHRAKHLLWRDRTAVSEKDAREFFELGETLHREIIVGNAGSPLIEKIYSTLQGKIKMAARMRYLPPAETDGFVRIPPEDTEEHIEIIDALISGSKVDTKKSLKQHLKAVRKRMVSGEIENRLRSDVFAGMHRSGQP